MGGRAVECTGLEIRRGRKSSVGSNPTPSASNISQLFEFLDVAFGRYDCTHVNTHGARGISARRGTISNDVAATALRPVIHSAAIRDRREASSTRLRRWKPRTALRPRLTPRLRSLTIP